MVENLTKQMFIEKISEFGEFNFKGDKPVLIKFEASWCGPCKMIAPIIEDLAKEYSGKVDVYKVDVDEEGELAGAFGVQSVPSLLFISKDGQPKMSVGALPKPILVKTFKEILGVE